MATFLSRAGRTLFIAILFLGVTAAILTQCGAPKPSYAAQASVTPVVVEGRMPVTCSNSLDSLIAVLNLKYKVNLIAVPEDFDRYTLGVFAKTAEVSVLILRDARLRYTVIVNEVEVGGRHGFCIVGAYRPFTAQDGI